MAKRKTDPLTAALSADTQPTAGATAVAEPTKPAPSAPKEAEPPRRETPSAIADLANRERELAQAAETVFSRLAAGETITVDETSILRSVGPRVIPGDRSTKLAYDKWVSSETARLATVRRLQSQAGTGMERAAANDAAATAESELEERAAKINAEVRKLTAEHDKLQTAATQARQAADEREKAVAQLRDKRRLPGFILDELKLLHHNFSDDRGNELSAACSRLAVLEAVEAIDTTPRSYANGEYVGGEGLERAKTYIEVAHSMGGTIQSRLARFGLAPRGKGQPIRAADLNLEAWRTYLDHEVRPEIATLREEITRMERDEATHAAELERAASYYVPQ